MIPAVTVGICQCTTQRSQGLLHRTSLKRLLELNDFQGASDSNRCFVVTAPGEGAAAASSSSDAFVRFVRPTANLGVARSLQFCDALLVLIDAHTPVVEQTLMEVFMTYANAPRFGDGDQRRFARSITVVTTGEAGSGRACHAYVGYLERCLVEAGIELPQISFVSWAAMHAHTPVNADGSQMSPFEHLLISIVDACVADGLSLAAAHRAKPRDGCRVHIIGKNVRERKLHVCVVGGVLQVGSVLQLPTTPPSQLTVSHVKMWGDDRVLNSSKESSVAKKRNFFLAGSVCSLDFRSFSETWSCTPVDVIAGCYALPKSSGTWADGMFPKRPLAIALEYERASRSSLLSAAVAQCLEKSSVQNVVEKTEIGVSFDGHVVFFGSIQRSHVADDVAYLVIDNAVAGRFGESVDMSKRMRGRGRGGERGAGRAPPIFFSDIAFEQYRLYGFPSLVRIVTYSSPTSIQVARIAGIQCQGYAMDAVVGACAWLDKKHRQDLESVIDGLTNLQECPLLPTRKSTCRRSVGLPLADCGRELSTAHPPFCSSTSVFDFLSSTFFDDDGQCASAGSFVRKWGTPLVRTFLAGVGRSQLLRFSGSECGKQTVFFVLKHVDLGQLPKECLPAMAPVLLFTLLGNYNEKSEAKTFSETSWLGREERYKKCCRLVSNCYANRVTCEQLATVNSDAALHHCLLLMHTHNLFHQDWFLRKLLWCMPFLSLRCLLHQSVSKAHELNVVIRAISKLLPFNAFDKSSQAKSTALKLVDASYECELLPRQLLVVGAIIQWVPRVGQCVSVLYLLLEYLNDSWLTEV